MPPCTGAATAAAGGVKACGGDWGRRRAVRQPQRSRREGSMRFGAGAGEGSLEHLRPSQGEGRRVGATGSSSSASRSRPTASGREGLGCTHPARASAVHTATIARSVSDAPTCDRGGMKVGVVMAVLRVSAEGTWLKSEHAVFGVCRLVNGANLPPGRWWGKARPAFSSLGCELQWVEACGLPVDSEEGCDDDRR